MFAYPGDAIAKEKEIKGWRRSKKDWFDRKRKP